jgi:hypothetical protein
MDGSTTLSLAAAQPSARKNVTAWQAHNHQRCGMFEKSGVPLDKRIAFVCECSSGDCYKIVSLTVSEHGAAHICPDWTAVLPYHVMDDGQTQVLTRHPHFWIVSWIPGGRDPLLIGR